MPNIICPIDGCDYATGDVDNTVVVALLTLHANQHSTANAPAAKVEKVSRPTITSGGTSEQWSYFLIRWDEYVTATKITGSDKVVQLLECCDDALRRDLTQASGGSLISKPDTEVLTAIKALAVREESIMIARVKLQNMRQDHEEPVRSYFARLRGQANVCKFLVNCPSCNTQVKYIDEMLKDVLIRGIADNEIQLDLLGHSNQDMSHEDVLKFVEAKETGKRSATRLLSSQGVEAGFSSYRKSKTITAKPSTSNNNSSNQFPDKSAICLYCGSKGHGAKASPRVRKTECPAHGKICNHCKKLNHYESMCRSKLNSPESTSTVICEELSTQNSLCAIDSTKSISLDHHLYNKISDTWNKCGSKAQPFLKLKISSEEEDYDYFGFTLNTKTTPSMFSVMADTGCQSCLIGMKQARILGFKEFNLIPVKMRMHAANNNGINILGAVILRFSGHDTNGNKVETRQLTYVTDDTDKIFLSREACIALGMISEKFPTVGENFPLESIHATESSRIEHFCDCPKRELPPTPPNKLPHPPTEMNKTKLKNFLLDYYKSSTFNICPHQQLPMMEGPPLKLMIDPDATPVACHNPVPVPIHWQNEVKKGLDQDVLLGVIEQVPIGEPVTWCHRMVVCAKKNGKPRRTVDLQPLNAHATRETHHTQSPFHQARSVPHNMKKTVFDAWNGYHSVPLRAEDRHFTTFITPWGRYRYRTAPQGYIASGDGYSRRYDEIVSDIPNKTKCIDDTLLWSDSIHDSFFQAVEWLDICGKNGIILNPDKFIFAEDDVEFAGFMITPNTVRPCDKYMDAIRDFPTPSSITDMRSWFGLVNQVSYAFAMAKQMSPFRQLLKPGTPFIWSNEMNSLFIESKKVIIKEIQKGVTIFDKTKPTCLATDWSKSGIGYWLSQKHCHCQTSDPFCCKTGWKIALIGSRFTHPAESRYAPIEGEALAVADALDKARYFVLGCSDLILAVDHKPLLKILSDRSLDAIANTRLRNLKEKTLRYKFRIVHIPGVKHKAADATSRSPTGNPKPELLHLPDDVHNIENTVPHITLSNIFHSFLSNIRSVESSIVTEHGIEKELKYSMLASLEAIETITWDKVRTATSNDEVMTELLNYIEIGMPDKSVTLPEHIREYHQFRNQLYIVDGVLIYKSRIVIPKSLRPSIVQCLHSAHQGASTMISRAESSIFWPGITADILSIRNQCNHCNRIAPSQPSAPPVPPVLPMYPFQCICADYFNFKGINYLVIVDRYSNWPIIERSQGGSKGLIQCLKNIFTTYGIADELSSDGGPEFTSHTTRTFLKQWGIHHRLSSVAFPHSNCRAEIGVKTAKRLIAENTCSNGDLDTDNFRRAILQHRNTPDKETKLSPAMCVFGRPIKDFIPILPGKYNPHDTWTGTLAAREDALRNRHMRHHEYWSEHTKRLAPLTNGDRVRIQNQTGQHPNKWDKTGLVIEEKPYDQYLVRVDGSGRATLRNRKFLRKFTPVQEYPHPYTIDGDYRSQWYVPHNNPLVSQSNTTNLVPSHHNDITTPSRPSSPPSNQNPTPSLSAPTLPSTPVGPTDNLSQRTVDMTNLHADPTQNNPPSPVTTRQSRRQRRAPEWHSDYDMTDHINTSFCLSLFI